MRSLRRHVESACRRPPAVVIGPIVPTAGARCAASAPTASDERSLRTMLTLVTNHFAVQQSVAQRCHASPSTVDAVTARSFSRALLLLPCTLGRRRTTQAHRARWRAYLAQSVEQRLGHAEGRYVEPRSSNARQSLDQRPRMPASRSSARRGVPRRYGSLTLPTRSSESLARARSGPGSSSCNCRCRGPTTRRAEGERRL